MPLADSLPSSSPNQLLFLECTEHLSLLFRALSDHSSEHDARRRRLRPPYIPIFPAHLSATSELEAGGSRRVEVSGAGRHLPRDLSHSPAPSASAGPVRLVTESSLYVVACQCLMMTGRKMTHVHAIPVTKCHLSA